MSNDSPHPADVSKVHDLVKHSLLLHTSIKASPHTNLLGTVCLSRIDRPVLSPVRKARNRALAVWTRAIPEERLEDASEMEHSAVDVDVSGSEFSSVLSHMNRIGELTGS
jgi:hypothetical protein